MPKPIILAVDDDASVLEAVVQDLRRHYGQEYRILRAGSGQAALDTSRQLKERGDTLALIVSDQRMPGMAGVDLLRQIQQVYPDARRVLLTAYADTEAAMKAYPLDFVQLDYSIGDRIPEERLLPLAKEKGIAVLTNRPFTTGNLFARVAGKPVPAWAAEFDATSWAQFFLKFVVSHPAVTCAIPATGDPKHLRDNMGACVGRLPNEATRKRMAELFATL